MLFTLIKTCCYTKAKVVIFEGTNNVLIQKNLSQGAKGFLILFVSFPNNLIISSDKPGDNTEVLLARLSSPTKAELTSGLSLYYRDCIKSRK